MAEINRQSRNVLPDQQPTFLLVSRAITKTEGGRTYPVGAGEGSCGQATLGGEFLYRWFRAEITATFGTGRPREERCADEMVARRGAGRNTVSAYEQSQNVL